MKVQAVMHTLIDSMHVISKRSSRVWLSKFLGFFLLMSAIPVQLSPLMSIAWAQEVSQPVISVANAADLTELGEVEVVDWVSKVSFSPDGSFVVSDQGDADVALWNVADLSPLVAPLSGGHSTVLWSTAISPDQTLLASADEAGTIRLWDVASQKLLGEALAEHSRAVINVIFHPDNSLLASLDVEGKLILWDVASRMMLAQTDTEHGGGACQVAFSPDGRLLATGGENSVIHLWDSSTLERVGALDTGDRGWTCGLAFSPDGKMLANGVNGNGANFIYFWDVATQSLMGEPLFSAISGNFFSLDFSPDGTVLAASGTGGFRLYDVATRESLTRSLTPSYKGDLFLTSTGTVAFSPDGTLLAVGNGSSSGGGEVHLWGIGEAE